MADAVPALASLRLSSTSFFSELKWLLSVVICWLLSATRFACCLTADAFGLRLVSGCQFVHAFALSLAPDAEFVPRTAHYRYAVVLPG